MELQEEGLDRERRGGKQEYKREEEGRNRRRVGRRMTMKITGGGGERGSEKLITLRRLLFVGTNFC